MLRILFFSFFFVLLQASTTKEGLIYLNTLRTNAGLIVLHENKALTRAANAHAKYLIQNQTHGHYEKKGKYAYSGKTPSLRVIKAGYPSRITMENISLNTPNQKKSIDNLFSAIYHRFVFLNLEKDEIGLGQYSTKKHRRIKHAYVYDLATSSISKLCEKSYTMKNGEYYMKGVCKNNEEMIPQVLLDEKKTSILQNNEAIILYPYKGQKDIYPAFYNESPDPLPDYKVSGFPISVQFNASVYHKVKMTSFKLFSKNGKEIMKTKILQRKTDPNHLLSPLEFVLMPLARLAFSQEYTVDFEAIADGLKMKRKWTFQTQKPKYTLYSITDSKATLHVKAGETIILYMVPSHRRDLLKNYRMKGGGSAVFMDQNTLKVTLPKRKSSGSVSISFGNKKRVLFIVK